MVYKDLFKTVDVGATTPEPTLFEIIFEYYNTYHNAVTALERTIKYVNKLKETQ